MAPVLGTMERVDPGKGSCPRTPARFWTEFFLSSAVLVMFFFPHGEIYQTLFLLSWKGEKRKSQNINAAILLLPFKKLSQ